MSGDNVGNTFEDDFWPVLTFENCGTWIKREPTGDTLQPALDLAQMVLRSRKLER